MPSGGAPAARVDEVGDNIFHLLTFVPRVQLPQGFTFNHFLVLADQPLLFIVGSRGITVDLTALTEAIAYT
jgi:hypothetical protein